MHIDKQIGDAVLVPPEGYEYMGWVTVAGKTQADARDNMDDFLSHIHFDMLTLSSNLFHRQDQRKNQLCVASTNKKVLLSKARIEKLKNISYRNQRGLKIGIACDQISPYENGPEDPSVTIERKLQKRDTAGSRALT